MNLPHRPVLVSEVLSGLNVRPDGIYVDGTVGAGGHAEAILERLGEGGLLIGIDCDAEILEFTKKRLLRFGSQIHLEQGHYEELDLILRKHNLRQIDGLLLDLGVSSLQLDEGRRGFSFRHEGPLDMRMDLDLSETAADLLQKLSEEKLGKIFWEFGEERGARRIANLIVKRRRTDPIRTTGQLAELLSRRGKRSALHPATRVFQALRIAVNRELDRLTRFLEKFPESLKRGGRVAIISYHSLEDRLVKRSFRSWADQGVVRRITAKPVRPSRDEALQNPRSRSAKLRVAERISDSEALS